MYAANENRSCRSHAVGEVRQRKQSAVRAADRSAVLSAVIGPALTEALQLDNRDVTGVVNKAKASMSSVTSTLHARYHVL